MSRSKHRQHGVQQWNPPRLGMDVKSPFCPEQNVASATDCTGLEAQPILSEAAADSYQHLYAIHAQKPQGNIGKGNPQNDPEEIHFHRS